MKSKRMLLMTTICAFAFTSQMTAYASPKAMPDGTIFDAEYYADTYPDVKAAFGMDEQALYNHYVQYGKNEGRSPAPAGAQAQPATTPSEPQSGVLIEEGDENYWRASIVLTGFDTAYIIGSNEWLHEDPANGYVRSDMSADPYYQIIRNEVIAALQASKDKKNIEYYSNYLYNPGNWEIEKHYRQVRFNLSIDLIKNGTLDHCYLMENPADGAAHYGGDVDYDFVTIAYLNSDYGNKAEMLQKHPELKGYL